LGCLVYWPRTINNLGLLHAEMGKLRRAESEELEALKLREAAGDSLEIARSWNSLAGLYFRHRKYAAAGDFSGERWMNSLSTRVQVSLTGFRLDLAWPRPYGAMNDCSSAIPLLKDGIDIARTNADRVTILSAWGSIFWVWPIGDRGNFFEAGSAPGAGNRHYEGTTRMGPPGLFECVESSMRSFYVRAGAQKRRRRWSVTIRLVEDVVDVHSIQTRKGVDALAGLR